MFASVASAQDGLFTLASDQPVVPHGASLQDWDNPYTDPGAVFFYDGKFRMFRNGFQGWPAPVQIGYLTSDDGINWTEASEDPVMMTKDVPYAKVAALASDALVLDDGTWVLYFYTWNTFSGTNSPGAIGRATASDPLGPWTPDPEPVLNPGSEGSWDELQVDAPRLVRLDDGSYRMYFSGYDQTGLAVGQDRHGDQRRRHHVDEVRRSGNDRRALRRKRSRPDRAGGHHLRQSADGGAGRRSTG